MKSLIKLTIMILALMISNVTNSQEFYFCEQVDDNWNPVNSFTTVNSAAGMNFLAKLDKRVYDQLFMWVIYRIDASGNDTEWVNELSMAVNEPDIWEKGARFFCTSQKVYLQPGSYRVYFIFENDKETHFKKGNLEKYLAKGEIKVE
jgi:hypothetical protein